MFFKRNKDVAPVYSPFANGTLIALENVPDQVFAQKMMGDGFAIEPTDGTIVAPTDGTLTVVFPTGHAYGFTTDDGIEILVHLGIDTVELGADAFVSHVSVGDKVKRGDKIATMKLDYIKEHGKSLVSPMIFTSGQAVTVSHVGENVTPDMTDVVAVNK